MQKVVNAMLPVLVYWAGSYAQRLYRQQHSFANYVPAKRSGNLVFTGGQTCSLGEKAIKGKLGKNIDIETGKEAARMCVINCLAAVKQLTGSVDNMTEIVAVHGLIYSEPTFTGQVEVMNGGSDLMGTVFGEQRRHTKTAAGVASLPSDFSASVYIIVEV